MREYELSEEELVTLQSALSAAEEAAIHPNAQAKYTDLKHELYRQHDDQDPDKATETEA